MEISSASANLYSTINTQTTQARNRQFEQDQVSRQAQQAQASSPQPQQANEAPQQPPVNEAGQSSSAQAEAERSRPVVNTSGQLVGTRVNTTA